MAIILAAKRIDAGCEVFAYTFASPATTERTSQAAKEAVIENYPSIFNIINEDDLVPQLPLLDWDFVRYGNDVSESIEMTGDYVSQWDSLMGGELTYTSNITSMENTVDALGGIADGRSQCYTYRTGITGYYVDAVYLTYDAAQIVAEAVVDAYPENAAGTYYWIPTGSAQYYGYAMYQQPAFLMQLIAAYMGAEIDKTTFITSRVATYLGYAKERIIALGGFNLPLDNYMEHPHYVESYYLLATLIS